MFQNISHKINYLFRSNRLKIDKIITLLHEIKENEREIVRLCHCGDNKKELELSDDDI